MSYKITLAVSALLLAGVLSAQIQSSVNLPVPEDLFGVPVGKSTAGEVISSEIENYALLALDAEAYAQLLAAAPKDWTLRLPVTAANPEPLTLHLRQRPLIRPDFQLTLASTGPADKRPFLGHHYVGEIAGEPGSRVSLSLLDDELTATLNRPRGERLALGKPRTQTKGAPAEIYVLFPDRQLLSRHQLDCATPDDGQPYPAKDLSPPAEDKSAAGCVDVYFEIDYDIFVDKGSAAAAQHLAANVNEVATLYESIGVNLRISGIMVWDQVSPYVGQSSSQMLTQFQGQRRSFNGDLGQLVSYQASGGIAMFDGLCKSFEAARLSFASIRSDFAEVPTFSWSTLVIAHEIGHQLGSQHTHACVWNGDNTAIDGCPGWTEGNCPTPGVPAAGGTLMSYCHLREVGTNFMLGFGPQPAAVIANRVAAARNCLRAVCAVDDGSGGNGEEQNGEEDTQDATDSLGCENQTVFLHLTLDDFGMETSWELRDEASDSLFARGGPYPKKHKGRTVTDTICVPEGCYVFTIRDDHFDGICCEYGPGRYELRSMAGNVLGLGSQFDTLDVLDFCLPDLPPEPDGDCVALNFANYSVLPYGSNQDEGVFTILDGGRTLRLQNNAWKAIEYPYTLTENTWLSFWFRSSRQGEMHGIGLDDNEVLSANLTFRLYGTQPWGIGDFATYNGDGQWRYYEIPVGEYYSGAVEYLFFTADHDGGAQDGDSYFRDPQISEGRPCPAAAPPAFLPAQPDDSGPKLLPNPASSFLRVELPRATPSAAYRVVDLSGRVVLSGEIDGGRARLATGGLRAGTYVFRYENGKEGGSKRFTVVH